MALVEFEKNHQCWQDRAVAPQPRPGATILAFPPGRMMETHRGAQIQAFTGDRHLKRQKARERIQFRK
jgi:hypothetical protein